MTALLLTLTLALFHWVGPVPADLGVHSGALSPCASFGVTCRSTAR